MAKFGTINLGSYDDFFLSSDARFLQRYVNTENLINVNYKFAYENFAVDPTILDTNADGVTPFVVTNKVAQADGMADFKAPMAQNTGIDLAGSTAYTGSIGNFGKGLNPVTVADREKQAKIIAQFGSESPLVKDYIEQVQMLQNHLDSTLSWMAGKMLTEGKILADDGFYSIDAKLPTANKVTAGKKAWTEASADILDYMNKIETNYRERTGDLQPMKWQIPLYMWRNSFLTNAGIKAKINALRTARELPLSNGGTVLEDWVIQYIQELGLTSPIEIVKEGEVKVGLDTRTDVKGWDNKYAVLRPIGYAGLIMHGEILKAKVFSSYQSKSVQRQIAYMNSGIYALINSVFEDANGMPVFKTDMEAACAPVLTEVPAHVVVDTSTADA